MDSLYSIDEEINFSDEDDEFLIQLDMKNKQSCTSVVFNVNKENENTSESYKSLAINESSSGNLNKCSNLTIPVLKNALNKQLSTAVVMRRSTDNNCSLGNLFDNKEMDDLFSSNNIFDEDIELTMASSVPNKLLLSSNQELIQKKGIDSAIASTPGTAIDTSSLLTLKNKINSVLSNNTINLSKVSRINESETSKKLQDNLSSYRKSKFIRKDETKRIENNSQQNFKSLTRAASQLNTLKRQSNENEQPMIFTKKVNKKPRRFPGPAGALPKLKNIKQLEAIKSPEVSKEKRLITPLTPKTPSQDLKDCSQDEDFSSQVWIDIRTEVEKLSVNSYNNISTVLKKSSNKKLKNGKVKLLYGLIKFFSVTGTSGKLILKDPSGEINGSVHRHVLEEFENVLKQGSGVILKDVSIYSPNPKKHYINITPSNIVQFVPVVDSIIATQFTQLRKESYLNKQTPYECLESLFNDELEI